MTRDKMAGALEGLLVLDFWPPTEPGASSMLQSEQERRAEGAEMAALYSGRAFAAEECARIGLLDVESPGTALEEATRRTGKFAENAPVSLAVSRPVLEALATGTAAARHDEISGAIDRATNSADYRQGERAFMDTRKPAFSRR
jgi:enoyl-CoA hydratase/carnithine racemase